MSSTVGGKSSVDCHTPPLEPFSAVKRRRCAHGFHVEPSNTGSGLPTESSVAKSVTRCAASASRFTRVT